MILSLFSTSEATFSDSCSASACRRVGSVLCIITVCVGSSSDACSARDQNSVTQDAMRHEMSIRRIRINETVVTISSSLMIILLMIECTISTFNSNISANVTKLNESYTELQENGDVLKTDLLTNVRRQECNRQRLTAPEPSSTQVCV